MDGGDHLCLVDWAVESGLADPERIGVMGLSGGGYMTTWLLGHYPGHFRAEVSENPVSIWVLPVSQPLVVFENADIRNDSPRPMRTSASP